MLCSVMIVGYGLSIVGGFALGGPFGQLMKRATLVTKKRRVDIVAVPA